MREGPQPPTAHGVGLKEQVTSARLRPATLDLALHDSRLTPPVPTRFASTLSPHRSPLREDRADAFLVLRFGSPFRLCPACFSSRSAPARKPVGVGGALAEDLEGEKTEGPVPGPWEEAGRRWRPA